MKKYFVLLLFIFALVSCGKQEKQPVTNEVPKNIEEVVVEDKEKLVVENNQTQNNMQNIDPKAQEIIDKYQSVSKTLSVNARNGEPTDADMIIAEELYELYNQLEQFDKNSLNFVINTYSYGYDLNVLVNGKYIGEAFETGGSFSSRLYNSDSILKKVVSPDVAAQNFVLNPGKNSITIHFKRKATYEKGDDARVEILGYDQDKIFSAEIKDSVEGKIEKTFIVESKKPVDFQPIIINQ